MGTFWVESESAKDENTASYEAMLDRYKSDVTKELKRLLKTF